MYPGTEPPKERPLFDDFISTANARMTEHEIEASKPHVAHAPTLLARLWTRIWHEDQEQVLEDSWRLADAARRFAR